MVVDFSQGETSIIMDLPDLIDTQSILTQREDLLSTPFSGAKTNTTFSALQLTDPCCKNRNLQHLVRL